MKRTLFALLLFPIFLLCACADQLEIRQNDCRKYIELNYLNYGSIKTDPISVREVSIDGDCLKITLQYSGGCEEHQIDLALIQPECGTPPLPPPTFEIRHDAKNDNCKALITKDYSFDISGIREQGKTKTDFILSERNSSGIINSKTYTYNY